MKRVDGCTFQPQLGRRSLGKQRSACGAIGGDLLEIAGFTNTDWGAIATAVAQLVVRVSWGWKSKEPLVSHFVDRGRFYEPSPGGTGGKGISVNGRFSQSLGVRYLIPWSSTLTIRRVFPLLKILSFTAVWTIFIRRAMCLGNVRVLTAEFRESVASIFVF